MKDFRLVAIDLDGTLLASDYTVSRRNRAAISKLVERGIRVTLCTGRMYASAAIYARELGLDTPLIAYQGALVKHAGTGEVIYERFVPLSLCRHLVLMARDYGLTINAYWQDELYVEKATPEAVTYARISQVPFREVGDLISFMQWDPIKVLVIGDPDKLVEMARIWQEQQGPVLYVTRSYPHYLEFLHPEATKGRGLEVVGSYYGIKREQILAIGDSWNDVEMFAYAGAGVAMGNAPEEVKRTADLVTATNDEDGVAIALENLLI